MERRIRERGTILLAIVGVLFVAFLAYGDKIFDNFITYPELANVSGTDWAFDEYADYFENLARDKDAKYAFNVLRVAKLQPGTDLHLLGHVVGDILYKQKGIDGIYSCTHDFRNACSHSIVTGLFAEKGIDALDEISDVCRQAPGGKGAYTMCFHGLGHGVLAYTLYDLTKAVSLCEKTGTAEYQNREYAECVGGEIMELISGGQHDENAWRAKRPTYLSTRNPLHPCDSDIIPDFVKPICYTYLTPYLFEVAGADLGAPTPENFREAFTYCNLLPKDDTINRDACYGGFGKEFVVLAGARDIRDIGSLHEEELALVHEWCGLANDTLGEGSCTVSALRSLFWGGENNPDASFAFCSTVPDRLKDACYGELATAIQFFLGGQPEKGTLCGRLPEAYRSFCLAQPAS